MSIIMCAVYLVNHIPQDPGLYFGSIVTIIKHLSTPKCFSIHNVMHYNSCFALANFHCKQCV